MRLIKLIIVSGIFMISCKNTKHPIEKFDKIKWELMQEDSYPYRDQMLDDLIKNHELHGLSKEQLIQMLGRPEKITNGYYYYSISRLGMGGFTIHTKTLVIKLNADSVVEWRKIHQ